MGNYQGKATGNFTWGEFPNGTTYVAVDVELFNDKSERHGVITHRFTFKEGSQKNIEISVTGLKLLGARMLNGDLTDLFGLGTTTAGIVTKNGEYGEEIAFINPPGPRARGVKDEEKLDAGRLAAFRAKMMPVVAGLAAASGSTPVAQPMSRAPLQGQRPMQAPAGAQPWDRQGPPASAPQQVHGDAGDPWNQPDAYEGLEQPSQAPQGYAPPQAAAGGNGGARRPAPF